MKQYQKSKPEDTRLVRDEDADPVERASALFRLSVDGFNEFEPVAIEWLRHRDLFLRARAIKLLVGYWGKAEYIQEAVRLLRTDPEWIVRVDAVFSLAQLAESDGRAEQYKNQVVHELVHALMHDVDLEVQKRSYEHLLKLLVPKRDYVELPDNFDRERDVDWELLRQYLGDQAHAPRRHEIRV